MSDERLRQLERQWKESKDTSAHARYISALSRRGLLDDTRIIAAAMWGHKACREFLGGDVIKANGVIFNDRLISTEETKDVIRGLKHLDARATRQIALGVLKLALETIVEIQKNDRRRRILPSGIISSGYTGVNVDLGTAVVYAEAFLTGNTTNNELWKVLRKINGTGIIRRSVPFLRRQKQSSLERIIYNGCIDIATHSRADKIPFAAVAWFTDDEILEAVRAELYPWALGDAK